MLCQGTAKQEAIKAENGTASKQPAVTVGEKPLKETLVAIKIDNSNSDALSKVILLKDSDNPKEEDEEDKVEE